MAKERRSVDEFLGIHKSPGRVGESCRRALSLRVLVCLGNDMIRTLSGIEFQQVIGSVSVRGS